MILLDDTSLAVRVLTAFGVKTFKINGGTRYRVIVGGTAWFDRRSGLEIICFVCLFFSSVFPFIFVILIIMVKRTCQHILHSNIFPLASQEICNYSTLMGFWRMIHDLPLTLNKNTTETVCNKWLWNCIIEQHTSHEIISGVQNRIQLWIKQCAQKIATNTIILPFYTWVKQSDCACAQTTNRSIRLWASANREKEWIRGGVYEITDYWWTLTKYEEPSQNCRKKKVYFLKWRKGKCLFVRWKGPKNLFPQFLWKNCWTYVVILRSFLVSLFSIWPMYSYQIDSQFYNARYFFKVQ